MSPVTSPRSFVLALLTKHPLLFYSLGMDSASSEEGEARVGGGVAGVVHWWSCLPEPGLRVTLAFENFLV